VIGAAEWWAEAHVGHTPDAGRIHACTADGVIVP
jgi:hypothetical protein